MKVIKISTNNSILSELFLRQTPGRNGIWADCLFVVNQPVDRCDWWFICHQSAVQQDLMTICDPDHIVFISMEPSEGATPQLFYKQFSKILLCDRSIDHSNIKYVNGVTWWAGIQVKFDNGHKYLPSILHDYDSFAKMGLPAKKNRISVICSDKNFFHGHEKRLNFLKKLRLHPISNYIDFFGAGHNPILDKLDAIIPYKYHIVLENSAVPDYWSEKLSDSFLGYSLPIYYGCPNIYEYFSNNSLIKIDIDDFEATIDTLERLIDDDIYEIHSPAINEARNFILDRYNIFQLIATICTEPAKRFVPCRVKPSWYFFGSWPRRFVRSLILRFRGILAV